MFWNARGIRNKITELGNLIIKEDVDVVGINETFLDENVTLPYFPGYSYLRFDNSSSSRGLLFIIKNTVDTVSVDCPPTTLFECCGIKIKCQTPVTIYLVYCPGGSIVLPLVRSSYTADLTALSTSAIPLIIMGDFDSKHQTWNCTRNNTAGNLLL